jgi:hypothetical protein
VLRVATAHCLKGAPLKAKSNGGGVRPDSVRLNICWNIHKRRHTGDMRKYGAAVGVGIEVGSIKIGNLEYFKLIDRKSGLVQQCIIIDNRCIASRIASLVHISMHVNIDASDNSRPNCQCI